MTTADRQDRQLASLVEKLYDAALAPEHWTSFLKLVTRTFDGELADFTHFDMDRRHHTVSVCVGMDPSEIQRYEEHFASRNVWANVGHAEASARVVIGEDLCPQADFERSEYYNDFLRPIGVSLSLVRTSCQNQAHGRYKMNARRLGSCASIPRGPR